MTNPAIPILRALWSLQRAQLPFSAAYSPYEYGHNAGRLQGRGDAFEAACNALTREQLLDAYTYLVNTKPGPGDTMLAANDILLACYIRALIDV